MRCGYGDDDEHGKYDTARELEAYKEHQNGVGELLYYGAGFMFSHIPFIGG